MMPEPSTLATKSRAAIAHYIERIRMFSPNARLFLAHSVFMGVGMGVFQVLFNFYILSLNHNEALLGNLITTNHVTALAVALPMGYLADRMGRKNALMLSAFLYALGILVMLIWPVVPVFFAMNVFIGLAQSLSGITQSPFLMENSGEKERTYLFSLSFGLRQTAMFVGNWLGGYLPGWVGSIQQIDPMSSPAYAWALGLMGLLVLAGMLPLGLLNTRTSSENGHSMFLPLAYMRRYSGLFTRLILPSFITSFGAGLFMPFMNVFFRTVHNQSDQAIGTIFAWGSLAMGLGFVIAPAAADRMSKIQLVVFTQALSIPFMFLLGYSPWFWLVALAYYVRLMTMNMSTPVYQTFIMEHVAPEARATVASLSSMAWNFGRAFSPTISGYLQVHYGFGPVFAAAIVFYAVSVYLYWRFFLRPQG